MSVYGIRQPVPIMGAPQGLPTIGGLPGARVIGYQVVPQAVGVGASRLNPSLSTGPFPANALGAGYPMPGFSPAVGSGGSLQALDQKIAQLAAITAQLKSGAGSGGALATPGLAAGLPGAAPPLSGNMKPMLPEDAIWANFQAVRPDIERQSKEAKKDLDEQRYGRKLQNQYYEQQLKQAGVPLPKRPEDTEKATSTAKPESKPTGETASTKTTPAKTPAKVTASSSRQAAILGDYDVKPSKQFTQASSGKTQYVEMARKAARRYGLPEQLFLNQIAKESGFNPNAKSTATKAKQTRLGTDAVPVKVGGPLAWGLGQFVPATGAQYGLKTEADLLDPEKSIDAAARHMRDQLQKRVSDKKLNPNGDAQTAAKLALSDYNAGQAATDAAGGVAKNSQTRDYAERIVTS
jgi:soluble lytic murein transglycosylase-like protein